MPQSVAPGFGIHAGEEMRTQSLGADVEARTPDFTEMSASAAGALAGSGSLEHLLDVNCTVTAELGRTKMSIGDVLKLNVGSVIELNRLVSEPVDVLVQGVLLARGEVVVVNDRFAIRIKEIVEPRKRS